MSGNLAHAKMRPHSFFVLSGHYYQWAGTTFHRMPLTRKVKEYSDLRAITSLPTKPLTRETRSQLLGKSCTHDPRRLANQHSLQPVDSDI